MHRAFDPPVAALRRNKHRRQVANDLKPIYGAVDADANAAAEALQQFDSDWDERYPMIGKTWREAWEHVLPFVASPPNSDASFTPRA